MDIVKIIAELRSERAAIEEALVALERLAQTRGKRRGRPPAWLSVARGTDAKPMEEKESKVSPEVRKKMAEAQRKRWAAFRKTTSPSS